MVLGPDRDYLGTNRHETNVRVAFFWRTSMIKLQLKQQLIKSIPVYAIKTLIKVQK